MHHPTGKQQSLDLNVDNTRGIYAYTAQKNQLHQQRLKNMFDQQTTLKRHGSQDFRQIRNTFDFDSQSRSNTINGDDSKNYQQIQPFQSQQQHQSIDYISGYQSLSPISRQYLKKKLNQSVQIPNDQNSQIYEYDLQAEAAQQPLGYFQQPLQSPQNNNLRVSQQQQQGPSHQYINLSNYTSQNNPNQFISNTKIQNQNPVHQPQITMTKSTIMQNPQQNVQQQYYFPSQQRQQYMKVNSINQSSDMIDYDGSSHPIGKNNMNYSQNLNTAGNNILSGNNVSLQKVSTIPTEATDMSYDSKILNNRIEYLYQENQQLTSDLQDTLNQSKHFQQQLSEQFNQRSQQQQSYILSPHIKPKMELNSSVDSLSNRVAKENPQSYQSKRDSVVFMNLDQVENIQSQLDEIKQYLQKQNQMQKSNEYKQSTLQTDLLLSKIISKKKNEGIEELKEVLASAAGSTSSQNLIKRQSALQALTANLGSTKINKNSIRQNLNSNQQHKVINHSQQQNQSALNKSHQNIGNTNSYASNNKNNLSVNITEKNETNTTSISSSIRSKNQSLQKSDPNHPKTNEISPFQILRQNSQTEREEAQKKSSNHTERRVSQSQDNINEQINKESINSSIEDESMKVNQENKDSQIKTIKQQNQSLLEQLEQKEQKIKQLDKQILQLQQEQIQIKLNGETEKGQLKNEILLLEGRLKQKDQFEEERLKHEEIIKEQQNIMKKNQDVIIQEQQQKYSSLQNDFQKAEKSILDLQMQIQNYQNQQMYMTNVMKEKDLLIEKLMKENQNFSGKNQTPMFNHQKMNSQNLNDQSMDQKSFKEFSLGGSGNVMGMQQQFNYDQIQKQYSHALEMKDREIMQLNGIIEQLNLKNKQYEESFNQIANSDQQNMMKQIQISKGTIEQLNQEIERYKQEIIQVQQFNSIQLDQTHSRTVRPHGQKSVSDTELLKQYQALQSQFDQLRANNEELKSKEAEYEQSINKLKAGFYEESESRKELENKLRQKCLNKFNQLESASRVVKELIQRKKNENNPNQQFLYNHLTGDGMNDVQLLQDIIQGLTIQLNEIQSKYDEEKEKQKADIRKLRNELELKKQECQKNVLEINRLNKELEFSEIKETLNDREEEMSQMKQRIEEQQKQIKSIQEKHLHDRNQIIKENESYVDRLKKEYEEKINYQKQLLNGGVQQEIPLSMLDENKAPELHINCLEQINALSKELATCKSLYQRALNDEMVQTQQLINSLNNALLEKRDKIDKIEEQKGEMQTLIANFGSQYKQFQESLLTASMSVTLESSHVFRDGQSEILKTLIEKVKDKKKMAQERAKLLEKENKRLISDSKRLQQSVRELEHKNTDLENLSHVTQQECIILQEKMKDFVEENKKQNEEIQILRSQVSQISLKSQKLDLESAIGVLQNGAVTETLQLMDINSQSLIVHEEAAKQAHQILELNEHLTTSEQPQFDISKSKESQSQVICSNNKQGGPVVIDQVYKQNIIKEYDTLLSKFTELQKKYKQLYAQFQEKLKSETVLQGIVQADNAKRKTLENNYKKLQEDYDKLEKIKKANTENIKKLTQKNVQNESIKAFFENQMKEYKDVIEKLQEQKRELEEKLKNRISVSSKHNKTHHTIESSYYNSNAASSIGGIGESSVVDPDQLLNELQNKINENCMLNMQIDELNEQIKVLTLTNQEDNTANNQVSVSKIVQEKQQLQQQVNSLIEENDKLKNELHSNQIEAQLGSIETSDLKVQCTQLQNKIQEQQDLLLSNSIQISHLQSQIHYLQQVLQNNNIPFDLIQLNNTMEHPLPQIDTKVQLVSQNTTENQQQQQIIQIEETQVIQQKQQQKQVMQGSNSLNGSTKLENNQQNLIQQIQNFNDYLNQEDYLCQSSDFNQYNPQQIQKEASVLKDLNEFIKNIEQK